MISEFGNIKDMWEFFKRHDSMYKELKAYEVFLEEGYVDNALKNPDNFLVEFISTSLRA